MTMNSLIRSSETCLFVFDATRRCDCEGEAAATTATATATEIAKITRAKQLLKPGN